MIRESDEEESTDAPPMPPLKVDEEVKEGKGLKILTPNKLLTRLSILFAKTKSTRQFTQIKK